MPRILNDILKAITGHNLTLRFGSSSRRKGNKSRTHQIFSPRLFRKLPSITVTPPPRCFKEEIVYSSWDPDEDLLSPTDQPSSHQQERTSPYPPPLPARPLTPKNPITRSYIPTADLEAVVCAAGRHSETAYRDLGQVFHGADEMRVRLFQQREQRRREERAGPWTVESQRPKRRRFPGGEVDEYALRGHLRLRELGEERRVKVKPLRFAVGGGSAAENALESSDDEDDVDGPYVVDAREEVFDMKRTDSAFEEGEQTQA